MRFKIHSYVVSVNSIFFDKSSFWMAAGLKQPFNWHCALFDTICFSYKINICYFTKYGFPPAPLGAARRGAGWGAGVGFHA